MRINRFQQYGGMAVTLACSLAVIAAAGAACVLRGFFFAKEMYLFLTLWFVLCGVLTLGGLVLYAASGWEKRLKPQGGRRGRRRPCGRYLEGA